MRFLLSYPFVLISLFFIFAASISLQPVAALDLDRVIASIPNYQSAANKIIEYVVNGPFSGRTYDRLARFVDDVGPRQCGSQLLEFAVDYLENELKGDRLENVHREAVTLPHWVRGNEWATAALPFRNHTLAMLGLGNSVSTGGRPITGTVIVVESFDELKARAAEAKGKIVVFNQQCDWKTFPTECYGRTATYRYDGPAAAEAVGAIAVLIRTLTGFSEANPHTGVSKPGVSIPSACITIEDVELLVRYQKRSIPIAVTLYMEAETLPSVTGHNLIAEIIGSELPHQSIITSGHLDSWDVGQGAMDDGCGFAISWSALSILRDLGLIPKRTVRFIAWSCEEMGGVGGAQYFTRHRSEVDNMQMVFESDMGVFKPTGLEFTGNANATLIMKAIGQLLGSINATAVVNGGGGEDINGWMNAGVPGGSLHSQNDKYFDFHHSQADTMTVLNSGDMDLSTALWAIYAYVVADLDDLLPR